MKKTPIHCLTITVVVLVFAWLFIERAQAEDDTNFLWEGDGSLTVVEGAKESGYVIKDGEVETYVVPSDTGNTFINDGSSGKLIVCNPAVGCY